MEITSLENGQIFHPTDDIPVCWTPVELADSVMVYLGSLYGASVAPASNCHTIPAAGNMYGLLGVRVAALQGGGILPGTYGELTFPSTEWLGEDCFWVFTSDSVPIVIEPGL